MEKMKNLRKIIISLLIFAIIITSFYFLVRAKFGGINEYIAELDVVYTPQKTATRFYYQLMSIDTFEYWIFKINNDEKQILLEDIEEGNWSVMTPEHIDKIEYFEHYDKVFGDAYKRHECYICIYDKSRNEVITESKNEIWQDTTKWIIFLYDTEYNRYYCVYETV